jgi:hypothetical protein
MKTQTTRKEQNNMATKADKDKLAKGAAAIRKADAERKKKNKKTPPADQLPALPDVTASERPIGELLTERVQIDTTHLSVTLSKETPFGEYLPIFDYFRDTAEHAGFMLGDIINQGKAIYGATYEGIMAKTGRAKQTLEIYATTSAHVPANIREPALTFTHHREVAAIPDKKDQIALLKDAKKNKWSVSELRAAAKPKKPKKEPRKPKANANPRKTKKGKPAPPPYEPSADETAQVDAALEALRGTDAEHLTAGFKTLAIKLSNKTKKEISAALAPYAELKKAIDDKTGYGD